MNILAIETSCDETSVAIIRDGCVASLTIHSQECHKSFGGIVPELASREHEKRIVQLTEEAMQKGGVTSSSVDVVCATAGPGLIGALLVGLKFAEAFAFALQKPFIPVNHIEAHIFSAFIKESAGTDSDSSLHVPLFPFLSLVASGGHTLLALAFSDLSISVLGKTRDDAAGEAFDKIGKMLGLGYPAGPKMDAISKLGDPTFHKFPRSMRLEGIDFSFSGLKTSVLTYLRSNGSSFVEANLANIAASVQEAIVDSLLEKTLAAFRMHVGVKHLSVSGGVSANSRLGQKFREACEKKGIELFIPKPIYSTDNAAMIGVLAYMKIARGFVPSRDYTSKAFSRFVG